LCKIRYFFDFELSGRLYLCLGVRVQMRKETFILKYTIFQFHSSSRLLSRARGYVTGSVLVLSIFMTASMLVAQEDVSLIQREVNRRAESVTKAEGLMKTGDVAYKASNFKKAVESYKQAFDLIPDAGLTHELRLAAGDRYAQAAVEYGKVLARTGQYDVARKHLDDVLRDDVAPGNVGAMKMLAKLDDPIRYSPTLEPDHVRDIEQVAHWLRKGESFFQQGQHAEALVAYEEAIKIDPYNKAARRGMERVVHDIKIYNSILQL